MSFINKSVNFSQTALLKTDILVPLLQMYNEHLLNQKKESFSLKNTSNFIIPNNNKKYYLLVTKKNQLEQTKENYNILYFFPDQNNKVSGATSKATNGEVANEDFYLEINNRFEESFLFEGYLYTKDNKFNYLVTDILLKNKKIVTFDYNLRFTMINEILMTILACLNDLNNHMAIGIHPLISAQNEHLVKIFEDNFIHKNELCCIEYVNNFNKIRHMKKEKSIQELLIEVGKYTDVYNVYDRESNDYIGILYIKGLSESKKMNKLFKDTTNKKILLKCKYNTTFQKWQPIF